MSAADQHPRAGLRIFAVIPAWNEGTAIGPVVSGLAGHVDQVVVVDDGSTDATGNVARAAGATVLRHAINRGQGAGLATGIAFALLKGADVIVTFDADGQHQPENVDRLVTALSTAGADVALGSRFLEHGHHVPPGRRLLLRAAVVFTRLTTGLALTDAHNGLRAFTAAAARKIRIRQDRMAHASEILSEIARLKLKLVEVPTEIRYTAYSQQKGQSALGAFRILLDLWVGKGVR